MSCESFSLLDFAPGAWLEQDASGPEEFAVWLDGDIIGSGATEEQAVAAARETVAAWNSGQGQ